MTSCARWDVILDIADTAHSLSRYSLYVKPDIKHNTLIFEEDRTEVREYKLIAFRNQDLVLKTRPKDSRCRHRTGEFYKASC